MVEILTINNLFDVDKKEVAYVASTKELMVYIEGDVMRSVLKHSFKIGGGYWVPVERLHYSCVYVKESFDFAKEDISDEIVKFSCRNNIYKLYEKDGKVSSVSAGEVLEVDKDNEIFAKLLLLTDKGNLIKMKPEDHTDVVIARNAELEEISHTEDEGLHDD